MRASRLVSIVLLLQAKGRVTAHDLASTLEVSVRTVYRDMEALSGAGIPVIGSAGTDGGYQLLDGYRTRLTGLTTDEASALFLAGVPAAAAAVGLSDEATTTQLKLLAAIPTAARERAELARQRVHIDMDPWGSAEEPVAHLPSLHRAIWDQTMIRLEYGPHRREHLLAPLGLVCKGGKWYLVAQRERELRTYRVARVHSMELTDDRFARPADFDLAARWQQVCASYVDTLPHTAVKVRIRGAARIRAEWVQAIERSVGEPDATGWADAEFTFEDEDHALTVIRTLGDEVFVCAPEDLRKKAVALAEDFARTNSPL